MAAVVGVGMFVHARTNEKVAGAPPGAASGAAPERPVPVIVAQVEARDLPIYLEGLGSIAPIHSVLVKPLVDGTLNQVFFKEGQFVKHGDRIAQIDPRPFAIALQSAQANLARDQAQLKNAKVNLERYRSLSKEAIVPEQQVTDQEATVLQLGGTIAADKAAIDNAKLQLDYANIKSPLDGVTGVRKVDPGNIVRQTDTDGIVVITQLDPIALLFTLPQDELPRVSERMAQGTLSVDAFSRDGLTKLGTGSVILIDNQIDPATATMRLKAYFPNPENRLWPNQFIKARLLLHVEKGALVVPATAVQRGPRGTFVYVVGPDQAASTKPVQIGILQDDLATIHGLSIGETVIIEGQAQLRPGSKVLPKPSAARGTEQGRQMPGPSGATEGNAPAPGAPGAKP